MEPQGPEMPEQQIDLDALDPHGPGKVTAPPWPKEPGDWLKGGLAFRWLDYAFYQVEKVGVVVSLIMMSVMMSLYTMYNNMIDEKKTVVLIGTLVLAAGAGFTHTSVKGKGIGAKAGLAAAVVGALSLLGWLVKTQHSQVVYYLLLVVALGGAAALWLRTPDANAALKAERKFIFLGVAGAFPVLAFLFSMFPRDYAVAEEYSKLLLFWVGFMGGSMATYHKSHLKIDFVGKLLKGRPAAVHSMLSLFVTALVTGIMFLMAYDYIFGKTGSFDAAHVPGTIPDWVKTGSITVSLGVMTLRFTGQAIGELLKLIKGADANAQQQGGH